MAHNGCCYCRGAQGGALWDKALPQLGQIPGFQCGDATTSTKVTIW